MGTPATICELYFHSRLRRLRYLNTNVPAQVRPKARAIEKNFSLLATNTRKHFFENVTPVLKAGTTPEIKRFRRLYRMMLLVHMLGPCRFQLPLT